MKRSPFVQELALAGSTYRLIVRYEHGRWRAGGIKDGVLFFSPTDFDSEQGAKSVVHRSAFADAGLPVHACDGNCRQWHSVR